MPLEIAVLNRKIYWVLWLNTGILYRAGGDQMIYRPTYVDGIMAYADIPFVKIFTGFPVTHHKKGFTTVKGESFFIM